MRARCSSRKRSRGGPGWMVSSEHSASKKRQHQHQQQDISRTNGARGGKAVTKGPGALRSAIILSPGRGRSSGVCGRALRSCRKTPTSLKINLCFADLISDANVATVVTGAGRNCLAAVVRPANRMSLNHRPVLGPASPISAGTIASPWTTIYAHSRNGRGTATESDHVGQVSGKRRA